MRPALSGGAMKHARMIPANANLRWPCICFAWNTPTFIGRRTLPPRARLPIIADLTSIAELQQRKFTVVPCDKGSDSVDFGIEHVQELRISYTRTSTNLHDEYENYVWKVKQGWRHDRYRRSS